MSTKVLMLGKLSISNGGKITTGLTNIVWDIFSGLSHSDDMDMFFLTPNSKKKIRDINNCKVYGFCVICILGFIFRNIHIFYYCVFRSLNVAIKYNIRFYEVFTNILLMEYGYSLIKPDILHIHGIKSFIVYKNTTFYGDVKSVMTIHGIVGWDENIENHLMYREIERQVSGSKISQLVFVSSFISEEWQKKYGDLENKYSVILNGIDDSVFYYNAKHEKKINKRIACVGTLSKRKGQHLILEALEKCSNSDKFEIYFAGSSCDDKYRKYLDVLISRINTKVNFVGHIDPRELSLLLNKCDFLLQPSSSEGFGLVFIESISCGTPVIISKELPLAKEPNVLNKNNSVFLNDSSKESIIRVLEKIDYYNFDREQVALSCQNIHIRRTILGYYDLYCSLFVDVHSL